MDLQILQYNTHKSRHVLEPLLASEEASKVDIIAVQEPWHSPFSNTSLCPRACPFYLIYLDNSSRVSFYINKKFSTDSWTYKFYSGDLVVLELFLPSLHQSIKIFNCYSKSLELTLSIPPSSPIHLLVDVLLLPSLAPNTVSTSTILIGDFNLHHPL